MQEASRFIIVVDEAYIEFSDHKSSVTLINEFENLVVFRTFSKAFGMAGLRLICVHLMTSSMQSQNKKRKNVSMISQRPEFALNNINLINDWINEKKHVLIPRLVHCKYQPFYKSNGNFVTFEEVLPKKFVNI